MNNEIICGIYKITSPSNRIYIGRSPNVYKRWKSYRNISCKNQPLIYRSLQKYGVAAHKFEIIEACLTEQLSEREMYYISLYGTYNTKHGLNLTLGGEGSWGYKHTIEAKKKVGDKNRGRIVSDEIRSKIKNTLTERYKEVSHHSKGKKQSIQLIEKRVTKNTGKRRTEETKKIMSQKAMGHKKWLGKHHTPETIEKIRNGTKGKKRTPETIERMRLSQVGTKQTELSIQKRVSHIQKIVLNLQTGIYYIGVKDASDSVGMKRGTLCQKLNGTKKNNTHFRYV